MYQNRRYFVFTNPLECSCHVWLTPVTPTYPVTQYSQTQTDVLSITGFVYASPQKHCITNLTAQFSYGLKVSDYVGAPAPTWFTGKRRNQRLSEILCHVVYDDELRV